MKRKRVLIVDDELNIRRILQMAFDKHGWNTYVAENATEALFMLEKSEFDCVLTDVTMPGMSGYQLQNSIAENWPEMPVVIMTAFGTIPQAVKAIQNGAFEYVTKPFDLEVLKKILTAAMDGSAPSRKTKKAKAAEHMTVDGEFVFASPAMKEIYEIVEQVADSKATVLITGESGTGKEVIAKLIHQKSPRRTEPFVAISCAALPDTLLESELFGYEKGAFTGADSAKAGRFELAHGGTLFMDEIGDIPMMTQIKLLRVLQERSFERLGATQPTKVDVRLVTATNRDLQSMVDEGEFRLDLLYRLQVMEIKLPPLRERKEDIEPLALLFLKQHAAENGRTLETISKAALTALQEYNWPGNVRELNNAMERAVVMAKKDETELKPSHLPREFNSAA